MTKCFTQNDGREEAALSEPMGFKCGLFMKNRFMLAPLTNCQSHDDGQLSDEEFHWLTMRAKGNFGLTMTCACHVQASGKGFPGQLGIFSEKHLEGHRRLAAAIREKDSIAVVQLHHAGMKSPKHIIGRTPLCPSDDEKIGARAMSLDEVRTLQSDFVAAAFRAQKAGYNGVEIHGAHGYLIGQFLSSLYNKRSDEYGGSIENRARIVFQILSGVREMCGREFLLGIRLSPEHFGILLSECLDVSQRLIDSGLIDFIDLSLRDSFKLPDEKEHQNQSLLEHFLSLRRKDVKITVAGKIYTSRQVKKVIDKGIDFVTIGRAAILHHDFPDRVMADPAFQPTQLPVTRNYLLKEGLSQKFIEYVAKGHGFL